jgi:hypothetical protein
MLGWLGLGAILTLSGSLPALTVEELQKVPGLSPQKFARHFSAFKYQRSDVVQPPEQFLATRQGDCDDYAILAAQILGAKGYTPRLVAVRTPEDVHVVCYFLESGSYLDFNNRQFGIRTVGCRFALDEIAAKVAHSLGSRWISVSEFTFDGGVRRLKATIFREAPLLAAQVR